MSLAVEKLKLTDLFLTFIILKFIFFVYVLGVLLF